MELIRVHDNGRITIPKRIRDVLLIGDGDYLEICVNKRQSLIILKTMTIIPDKEFDKLSFE